MKIIGLSGKNIINLVHFISNINMINNIEINNLNNSKEFNLLSEINIQKNLIYEPNLLYYSNEYFNNIIINSFDIYIEKGEKLNKKADIYFLENKNYLGQLNVLFFKLDKFNCLFNNNCYNDGKFIIISPDLSNLPDKNFIEFYFNYLISVKVLEYNNNNYFK